MYDFSRLDQLDLRKSAQSVTAFKANRTHGTPNKIINKFWEEIKLSKDKETILLLAGEYTSLINGEIKPWKDYLLHKELYVAGKAQKEIVCSAGTNPYAKKPCIGCYYFDNGPKKENPWYPKVVVKFNALSLAFYHDNVPYVNKEGQPVKKDDGKVITIKQRCMGKTCTLCPTYGKPSTFGRLMKLVLPGSHFQQLDSYNKKLLQCCAGCGKTIVLNEFSCAKCEKQLLNIADNHYSEEFLDKYSKTPQECECGFTGLPKEGLDCGYDEDGLVKEVEDCPLEFPVRMNIFSTILSISKEGEKSKSALVFGEKKSILEKSKIKYNSPVKLPLSEILASALKVNGDKLFNLDDETQIKTPEEQAALLGLENPYVEASLHIPPGIPVPQIPMGNFPVQFPRG